MQSKCSVLLPPLFFHLKGRFEYSALPNGRCREKRRQPSIRMRVRTMSTGHDVHNNKTDWFSPAMHRIRTAAAAARFDPSGPPGRAGSPPLVLHKGRRPDVHLVRPRALVLGVDVPVALRHRVRVRARRVTAGAAGPAAPRRSDQMTRRDQLASATYISLSSKSM